MLRNTVTRKILIASSRDLASVRSRLDVSRSNGSTGSAGALDQRLLADARAHGMASFEFVVLDLIEVREGEAAAEITADLAELEALWREKLQDAPQY